MNNTQGKKTTAYKAVGEGEFGGQNKMKQIAKEFPCILMANNL